MSLYKTIHHHASKLGLNRFGALRKGRHVLIRLLNARPVLVNKSFLMYVDDYDSLDLLANKTYEPEVTKQVRKSIKGSYTALDIGANIGYYTMLFAQTCKKVYAFEAERRNFSILSRNIALNKLENRVVAEHLACSDKNAPLRLNISPDNRGGNNIDTQKRSASTGKAKTEAINGIRLDDYFKGKKPPDIVKIDIEGHEPYAIRGGIRTLSRAKIILFENHEGKHSETARLIKSMGFSIKQIDKIDYCAIKD